jgi:transposase
MDASAKSAASDREPATRRYLSLEEKLRILEEAKKPGASVASVARRYGLNANLVFGWRRLQKQGALQGQRQPPPPLLPVTISAPTITPTERTPVPTKPVRRPRAVRSVGSEASGMEIILPNGIRLHLHGDAERAVLACVMEWLARR